MLLVDGLALSNSMLCLMSLQPKSKNPKYNSIVVEHDERVANLGNAVMFGTVSKLLEYSRRITHTKIGNEACVIKTTYYAYEYKSLSL
jgi:hypothetical protein